MSISKGRQNTDMENITRLRLLYLYRILEEETDADHPKSTAQLMQTLKEKYGIDSNRISVGRDLKTLCELDFPIEVTRSTQNWYCYDGQPFENAELKLLIDAVASSKFISASRSKELTRKLCKLTNYPGEELMHRDTVLSGRVKSRNASGYYIVDTIMRAIDLKRKITFKYTEYDSRKRQVLRNGGKPYVFSPYTLMWDGDFYYVVGYSESHNKVQSFRLDRIYRTPEILDEPIVPAPADFNVSDFSKQVFRMFDTDVPENVTLLCEGRMMGYLIDQFGEDVSTSPVDKDRFRACVKVCPSPTFFRWVFGFDGAIKIESPAKVKEKYREMLEKQIR
jgi:predicted DNA-binding transcriptional regulator YafY